MTTVGLFSGIGGLELGLSRAGHQTVLLCENDKVARAVLDAKFPDIRKHSDVRELESLPRNTQLVAAGFPCQDLSQAGRTAGINGEKSGLISEVFRLLRTRRVPWVLLENVPFMLHVKNGKAFDHVVAGFEELGYRWAYRVVDSRAFGLPQRRERVFFLASLQGDPRACLLSDDAGPVTREEDWDGQAVGFYWTEGNKGLGWTVNGVPTLKRGSALGIASPPGILLPDGRIIKPDIRDAERLQGFPLNWTAAAKGNHDGRKTRRWGLVGNAVSVDVAEWLGRKLRRPKEYVPWHDAELKPGTMWPRAAWSMGKQRHTSDASAWPVRRTVTPLDEFLRFEGELLSEKATRGFYERARASRLNIPDGFLEQVARHLESVRKRG
jgi:DNA (cytosine-5)-methyltransferase 1